MRQEQGWEVQSGRRLRSVHSMNRPANRPANRLSNRPPNLAMDWRLHARLCRRALLQARWRTKSLESSRAVRVSTQPTPMCRWLGHADARPVGKHLCARGGARRSKARFRRGVARAACRSAGQSSPPDRVPWLRRWRCHMAEAANKPNPIGRSRGYPTSGLRCAPIHQWRRQATPVRASAAKAISSTMRACTARARTTIYALRCRKRAND